jgi:hypothetical protein
VVAVWSVDILCATVMEEKEERGCEAMFICRSGVRKLRM